MSNTLTNVIPTIFAQGFDALREYCVMPRLVNTSYSNDAQAKGNVVNIPIPSAITAVAVTPAAYAPDAAGSSPTVAQITLDQWYEAPFDMTDKDIGIAVDGTVPRQVSEAIRSLANNVNSYILSKYTGIYGYAGVAGTTPFSVDLSEATQARKVLNRQLAPTNRRVMVLDPEAEAKALDRRAVQDASFRNSAEGIREGNIGRTLGMDWYMDQAIPTHTAGTITTGLIAKASTAVAAGLKTFAATTAASTGACNLKVGDVIAIAGHTTTYVLTATAVQASASTDVTLTFTPGLERALAGSEAITVKATHVVNLAFHPDAFGFASRLMQDTVVNPADRAGMMAKVDPVSGLALRLEVRREFKRTRWSFDMLYGASVVRPEFACRVAG